MRTISGNGSNSVTTGKAAICRVLLACLSRWPENLPHADLHGLLPGSKVETEALTESGHVETRVGGPSGRRRIVGGGDGFQTRARSSQFRTRREDLGREPEPRRAVAPCEVKDAAPRPTGDQLRRDGKDRLGKSIALVGLRAGRRRSVAPHAPGQGAAWS